MTCYEKRQMIYGAVPYRYKPFQPIPMGNAVLNMEFEKECPLCGEKYTVKGFNKTDNVECIECGTKLVFTLKEMTKRCEHCGNRDFDITMEIGEWSKIECRICGAVIQRLSDAIKEVIK